MLIFTDLLSLSFDGYPPPVNISYSPVPVCSCLPSGTSISDNNRTVLSAWLTDLFPDNC
jgi:hypothetical protein